MDLNWLRDFESLARTRNFTRAADELSRQCRGPVGIGHARDGDDRSIRRINGVHHLVVRIFAIKDQQAIRRDHRATEVERLGVERQIDVIARDKPAGITRIGFHADDSFEVAVTVKDMEQQTMTYL